MKAGKVEHLEQMARGRTARSRKCADRIVSGMALDVANWEDVTITYSLVTREYNEIIYRSKGGYRSAFYDRNDNPWDISLRGENYWAAALMIVKWYHNKKIRHGRGRR